MKKFITIFFFHLAFTCGVFSQANLYAWDGYGVPEKISRLKKELSSVKDSARIDCLNGLGECYLTVNMNMANLDTATFYSKQALKEAEGIKYIKGQASAFKNLGRMELISITDLPSAEKYLSKSVELFSKTKDTFQLAWVWGALGVSKWVLSKFPEAFNAFEKAETLFKKIGDSVNLAGTYDFVAYATSESGQYSKSLEYTYKKSDLTGITDDGALSRLYYVIGDEETAKKYAQKIQLNYDSLEGFDYLGLGCNFLNKKKYDSALYYLGLFSNFAKLSGPGPLIKLDENLGLLQLYLKHYDTALVFFNRALNLSTKVSDNNQVMNVLLYLSKAYQQNDNYKMALVMARRLLQISNKTGARQMVRDANLQLFQIFDHLQQKDSALIHLKKYTVLKDAIDLDLSAQKIAFYEIKSEREQTQGKLDLLSEKNRLQQQQLKQTAQQRKMLVAGIFVLLLLGVLLFRNILLKRKSEKKGLELAENELKIQQLENKQKHTGLQQRAADLEMQALRAQMNPHFIFNCLNAINKFILINEPETAANYLTKFSRLIRMVLNNSQKKYISLDEELLTLGLYLHLESLRFENSFQYHIKCDDSIDLLSVFIPPLLLQPFAENAIWHGLMHKAGPGELTIDLHLESDILHCIITDNGIGRKKAAMLNSKSVEKNKSMGLKITKNRISLLNYDLKDQVFFEINDLEDALGNAIGTSVSLKIKVKKAEDELQKNIHI